MKEIRLPAWREAIVNFMTMLSANLIYEALHKLRELGQGVFRDGFRLCCDCRAVRARDVCF
jgi:hypothetical protein